MMLLTPFVALLSLPLFTSASPLAHKILAVSLSRRSTNQYLARQILEHDHARLAGFNARSSWKGKRAGKSASVPVTNVDMGYIASVTVGLTQKYNMAIDTGIGLTFIGTNGWVFAPDSSTTHTSNTFFVEYGSVGVFGDEWAGPVSLGGVTASHLSFGVASSELDSVNGVIGLGPVSLTYGDVTHVSETPTFMQVLTDQGTIPENVLGISFRPLDGLHSSERNGELTLGGTNPSKYTGDLTYVALPISGPTSSFWSVQISSISYGTYVLGNTFEPIIDTGTALILVPPNVYGAFLAQIGGTTDSVSNLPKFAARPTENVMFAIEGLTLELTPTQYLIPEDQYSPLNLTMGHTYSWIANSGESDSYGITSVIGQKFLENYYSVFDVPNSRIGFAKAA